MVPSLCVQRGKRNSYPSYVTDLASLFRSVCCSLTVFMTETEESEDEEEENDHQSSSITIINMYFVLVVIACFCCF